MHVLFLLYSLCAVILITFLCSYKYYRHTQCFKITEKVSFNIASEASYVYISSRQKFFENGKDGQFFLNETFLVIFKHCVSYQKEGGLLLHKARG